MKWCEERQVSPHDTDLNSVATASALVRFMQDAANSQLHNLGPSNEKLRDDGKAFILSRIVCDFYIPIVSYDTVSVETWSIEERGFSLFRNHRIIRGRDTIALAESTWALVDTETKKPLRASEFKPNFDSNPRMTPNFPARMKMPNDSDFSKSFEYTVLYSDTDINRHMNNTKYPDLYCNGIDMCGKRVSGLSISFLNEAPIGERLSVYTAKSDRYLFFRTVRSDGKINTEAAIELIKL